VLYVDNPGSSGLPDRRAYRVNPKVISRQDRKFRSA
jgi:hypothetical protein